MKQNTPEEEKLLINESAETGYYRFIYQKIQAYKRYSINDVIVDESSKRKYKITYIDADYGFVYGRRICNSGALSKNMHHITGMHTTFVQDINQIDAMLLDSDYDPAAQAKVESRHKKEAYKQRVKQRVKLDNIHGDDRAALFSVGQTIWITHDSSEDRVAHLHNCVVNHIDKKSLHVTYATTGDLWSYWLSELWRYHIYLKPPITWRGTL